MSDFNLPSLGADMDEGTVVEWMLKPGDPFSRGDVIALVETQKGVIEVEVWQNGFIEELLVEPGTVVRVGSPIARIADAQPVIEAPTRAATEPEVASESLPVEPMAKRGQREPTPPVRHLAHELDVDLEAVRGSGPGGEVTRDDIRRVAGGGHVGAVRVKASPLARRAAEELGVELGSVVASRADGVITADDVAAFAASAESPHEIPVEEGSEPRAPAVRESAEAGASAIDKTAAQATAMRQAIADVMARSKREIPHYYLATTIDMSRALTWLEEANRERGVAERILPAVLLLKASALAIKEVPEMNGFFIDGAFHPSAQIHLGVAISLRKGGLIAPAIHDADELGLDALMAALRDLVSRTRSGRLRSSEMSDPTITITNLGDRGVETLFPVIYAPQVAIVGFGKVVERPWAEGGMLGIRPTVSATLSADHRVSDGHRGGIYLAAIDRLLQRPEEL